MKFNKNKIFIKFSFNFLKKIPWNHDDFSKILILFKSYF